MKEIIPLFPDKMVLFPGQESTLNISEKRYKKLIEDCWQNNATFGVQPIIGDKVQNIGTEVEIVKFNAKEAKGQFDITVKGRRIYKLLNHRDSIKNEWYSNGVVAFMSTKREKDHNLKEKLMTCLQQFEQFLFSSQKFQSEFSNVDTIYDLLNKVGLSLKKQYLILANPSENGRKRILLNHCRQQHAIEKQLKAISDKLVDN